MFVITVIIIIAIVQCIAVSMYIYILYIPLQETLSKSR